ncbi:MAG: EAL domain-containing protein [Alphaproteobacteria bacterium]|nr:EAL domain-containing protein [Alphaproteobacteria bacterium]MBV9373203.1 EAL domain-containing protein [Alphaproteobacteria bacterium]MBV9900292.1 EAL domain-containing protein [Alphaproteobacteria bacterium]
MADDPLTSALNEAVEERKETHDQIDAILGAVREHLGMEIAFTSRYVGEEREFTHISADIAVPAAPGDREPVEGAYCWHILHDRLPQLIANAADLPFAGTLPITHALPVGAHISVPLRLKDGRVYGSFCCLSRSADYSLTGRDLAIVRAFADLASAQIEREEKEGSVRADLTARIRRAIDGGQPAIHLQPIHCLATARTVGAEALARFEDARERPPSCWFAEADEVGLGVDLDLAAVRQAVAALPYVPAGQYLSVNVSPATILCGALHPIVSAVAGGALVLEITEHSRIADYAELRRKLAPLRKHARIAVDDVGAGYASLQHIIRLAPDILKLDIGLTRSLHRDPAKRALALALVSFADQIGSTIVAEGIEREEERKVLAGLGVRYGQGWLFSRAMPVVSAQQRMLGADAAADPAPRRRPPALRTAAG